MILTILALLLVCLPIAVFGLTLYMTKQSNESQFNYVAQPYAGCLPLAFSRGTCYISTTRESSYPQASQGRVIEELKKHEV